MYKPGDFSFCEEHESCYEKTYRVLSELNVWDYIATHNPNPVDPVVMRVIKECEKFGVYHTYASVSVVMRDMHLIAKKGWEGYLNKIAVV
jgi:hypothetical protein